MELRWEIPEFWGTRHLGDIAPEDSTQISPSDYPERIFNYWGLDAIEKNQFDEPEPNYVPGAQVQSTCVEFDESHVLYCKLRPYLNKVIIPTVAGIGSTEWIPLKPQPELLDRKYLAFVLRSQRFVDYASSNTTGARMPRARKSALWDALIPIPYPDNPARSLTEQRRIVARLEAMLAEVREIRALQAEIEVDAGRLMDAVIQDVFDQPNAHWQTSLLTETAFIQTGTAKGRHFGGRRTIELPYLRVANVQAGYLDLDEIKTITIAEDEIDRYRLQPGDLLLTEGGDYDKLGRGAVWEGQIASCIHQNHIFAVRFDPGVVLPKFAEYEMQSWHAKSYFLSVAKKTTNLATINKKKLGNFPLRYPLLAEQQTIVAQLDAARAEITEMQKLQSQDTRLVEQLEQAILAQAFRGEL
ncbi:MAG: restriction endonuclease [Anaerolineae bacterium]|nr:restriction endonuclease [Anaerolineae bacterium]